MAQILIEKCVRCPIRCDGIVAVDYCDGCEWNNIFHNTKDGYIHCEYDE